MTGKTHKRGGMLMSLVGFIFLKHNNMLLSDVYEILQWLVMYPFCIWGSMANDLDKNWAMCPSKDYPSRVVHAILHVASPVQALFDKSLSEREKKNNTVYRLVYTLNAHHRSWQTHSDFTLIFLFVTLKFLMGEKCVSLGAVNSTILLLVFTGVAMGMVEHILLDMFTPEGIKLVIFILLNKVLKMLRIPLRLPEVFRLVPKMGYFATGGNWENAVNKWLKTMTNVLFVLCLFVYFIKPLIPFEISF